MPTPESDRWLARVFGASNTEDLIRSYDEWAASYDADMVSIGYTNPSVAAALVTRYAPALDSRILDAGVGTGILGEILAILGYRELAGIDISEGMLAKARDRGVYRDLRQGLLGEALEFADASFDAIVSIGVFVGGHAPPTAFDELVRITRSGGHMIFTVAASAWEDGGFRAKIETLEGARRLRGVEVTGPYRPMPLSPTEGSFRTRCFVYRVL